MSGASIRQIVAIDRSNHGMSEIQVADSFSNVPRLFRIEGSRLSFTHCAKAAVARADISAEHEGRGPIGPAFENIGTTRFLTDAVQIESLDQLRPLFLIGRVTQAEAQAFGLRLTDLLIIADFSEFAGQLFTSGGILRPFG